MARQVGQFFLFVGLILMVIFFATDQVEQPAYGFFCPGVILLGLGLFMMFRWHGPQQETGRFRLFRKKKKKT